MAAAKGRRGEKEKGRGEKWRREEWEREKGSRGHKRQDAIRNGGCCSMTGLRDELD